MVTGLQASCQLGHVDNRIEHRICNVRQTSLVMITGLLGDVVSLYRSLQCLVRVEGTVEGTVEVAGCLRQKKERSGWNMMTQWELWDLVTR